MKMSNGGFAGVLTASLLAVAIAVFAPVGDASADSCFSNCSDDCTSASRCTDGGRSEGTGCETDTSSCPSCYCSDKDVSPSTYCECEN